MVTAGKLGPLRRWLAVPVGLALAAGVGGVSALSATVEIPSGEASAQQSDSLGTVGTGNEHATEDTQSGSESMTNSTNQQSESSEAPTSSTEDGSSPGVDVTTQSQTTPTVVSATYEAGVGIVVRAVVVGVVDDSGTCTLQATGPGQTVRSATGEAVSSADSMNCVPGMIIPDDELADGSWQILISYESAVHAGTSLAEDVEVDR